MSRQGAIGSSPTAIGVRYGYRRVQVLLRREGWQVNIRKTRRIYTASGLQHPKRRAKARLRDDRQEAVGPNDVWAGS